MDKSVRLGVFLGCVALATSRLGLVAHELGGHGGATLLLGGRIVDVRLFWFAGGWLQWRLDSSSVAADLAIAMAGIAVEFACGLVVWLALRRARTIGARVVRAVGAALVVHAGWYLATGAWHGFGDGAQLYQELGEWRAAVAIPAALVTCAAAYAGARAAFGAIAAAARPVGVAIALALALGANVALVVGELRVRRDATYAETMAPEREREVARDLARWQDEQRRRGAVRDDAAEARERARLEAEHRTFPFWLVLAIATLAAVVLGAWRSPRGDGEVGGALVARAAIVAALALALVIALAAVV